MEVRPGHSVLVRFFINNTPYLFNIVNAESICASESSNNKCDKNAAALELFKLLFKEVQIHTA